MVPSAARAAAADTSNIVERAYVLWNRSADRQVVEIPASGSAAQLYDMTSHNYVLDPQDGKYEIGLPAVATSDFPQLTSFEVSGITGAPYILIEQVQRGWTPVDPQLIRIQGVDSTIVALDLPAAATSEPLIVPTDVPPPTAIPQPTVDPADDTSPPIPLMQPLPVVSPPTFTVTWSALDNSGIASYIVWVRVNGGDWQNWLETSATSADYSGSPGNTYEFALWAVDLAGNWSQNVDLSPQAVTAVQ